MVKSCWSPPRAHDRRSGVLPARLPILVALAAVLAIAAAAGCDRTTKRGVAAGMQTAAAAPGPQSAQGGVRFVFEDPNAQTVALAGDFNNWSTSADPLTKDAQGRWTIVKAIPPGSHQYKFVINDGQTWEQDPANPSTTDDGFGGKNSVLMVDASGGIGSTPAAAGGQSSTPIGKQPAVLAGLEGPKKVDAGWLFAIDLPEAQNVALAGSFNSWSTSADPMTKDTQGRWRIVKALSAGHHQYKFVVDGGQQWKEDPNNSNTTDDGYGGKNSVLVVP